MYRPFRQDLTTFILEQLPIEKRMTKRVEFIYWLLRPLYLYYRQTLQPWYDNMMYGLDFNSQKIKLQWLLNDVFDPNGEGITVTQNLDKSRLFIYPKESSKPKHWCYSPWRSGQSYVAGNRITKGGYVWQAKTSTTGHDPLTNPSKWDQVRELTYVRSEGFYQSQPDFYVDVPASLNLDTDEISALVQKYIFTGISFEITES